MFRLFRRKQASSGDSASLTLPATVLNRRQRGFVPVVGESHYQDAIKDAVRNLLRNGEIYETQAVLVREPDNEYDPNAVAVYLENGGKIGYLSREAALAYQPVLQQLAARKRVAVCAANITGGTVDKPNWGVFLDVADPDEALSDGEE